MRRSGVLVALAGCVPAGEVCGQGEPALEVGVGERAFAEAPPGTEASVAFGSQGGWHVWLAVAATGLEDVAGEPVHVEGFVDGELVAEGLPLVDFRCDRAEARWEAWGLALQFFDVPEAMVGRTVDVAATILFTDGTQLEDTTSIVVVDAP